MPADHRSRPRSRRGASKNNYIPDDIEFQTKPQIALDSIDRAVSNGIRVTAWTFDELYGRDSEFLDGLDDRERAYVAEMPCDTHVRTTRPHVIRKTPAKTRTGRPPKTPRVARQRPACEVRNLVKYSSKFQVQSWQ
jgi:SRSO17 transposase